MRDGRQLVMSLAFERQTPASTLFNYSTAKEPLDQEEHLIKPKRGERTILFY